MKMRFISRHAPTEGQIALALARGFELVHVGDVDAFEKDGFTIRKLFAGACGGKLGPIFHTAWAVVHPALALDLCSAAGSVDMLTIGVFENANRAPVGEKPTFEAVALHLWEFDGMASPMHRVKPEAVDALCNKAERKM